MVVQFPYTSCMPVDSNAGLPFTRIVYKVDTITLYNDLYVDGQSCVRHSFRQLGVIACHTLGPVFKPSVRLPKQGTRRVVKCAVGRKVVGSYLLPTRYIQMGTFIIFTCMQWACRRRPKCEGILHSHCHINIYPVCSILNIRIQ